MNEKTLLFGYRYNTIKRKIIMKYIITLDHLEKEVAVVMKNDYHGLFLSPNISRGYFSIDCVGGLFIPSVSPEKKERLELDKGILTQLLNNEI